MRRITGSIEFPTSIDTWYTYFYKRVRRPSSPSAPPTFQKSSALQRPWFCVCASVVRSQVDPKTNPRHFPVAIEERVDSFVNPTYWVDVASALRALMSAGGNAAQYAPAAGGAWCVVHAFVVGCCVLDVFSLVFLCASVRINLDYVDCST
jgi:hypothetical protein